MLNRFSEIAERAIARQFKKMNCVFMLLLQNDLMFGENASVMHSLYNNNCSLYSFHDIHLDRSNEFHQK